MITLDSFSSLGEAPRALVQDVLGGRAPHAVLISENRLTLEGYISLLTPGLYFVSGEYLITRQSADAAFLLPDGFASAEISPDNTGYYIITARLDSDPG